MLSLLKPLWATVQAPDFWMSTDFVVEPGASWVTLSTTYSFVTDPAMEATDVAPVDYFDDGMPLLDWAIELGLVAGDFYLSGGSADVFAPRVGFDEDGAVFEKMNTGGNTLTDPFQFPFLASVGEGVSYGIAPADGDLYVPLFTSSQTVAVGGGKGGDGTNARFDEGAAFVYDRYFFVGHGDVGSVLDGYLEARGVPSGSVSGVVTEQVSGTPLSGVDVFVYEPGAEAPFSQWETDVHPLDVTEDGSFAGTLPVGDWELAVHEMGRAVTRRQSVKVREGARQTVHLTAPRSGELSFEIRDEFGDRVPSKLSIFRMDGPPRRDPVLGDGFIGGSPESVLFAMEGRGRVQLAPGRYQAIATRGLEYEMGLSEPFRIDEVMGAEIALQVVRSVDTTGWISADFHVHGEASHDSGVSRVDRVGTMVAEGVEFFAATDHDYIVDYAPTVEALGMSEWVQTAAGVEVTTVEVGHFLGFPLEVDHMGEAGTKKVELLDWTGKSPTDIILDLRTIGEAAAKEPMVFVAHPRDGILGYFDQWGFTPYAGTPGFGGEPGLVSAVPPILSRSNEVIQSGTMSWDFDAIELITGKRLDLLRTPTQRELDGVEGSGAKNPPPEATQVYDLLERTLEEQQELQDGVYRLGSGFEGTVDDWFTLLNLGYRFTALGNSDTHGFTGTESGCPRNFVQSDTDVPAFLDDQAIADAVKEHRVVASFGPFVEMEINGALIGSDVISDGEEIEIAVRVQAPSWMGIDRVELYENGTLVHEWELEDTGEVLRLDDTLLRTPDRDSWYVITAMGASDLHPVFTPVEVPYVELQSVVEEALVNVEAVAMLLEPSTPIPRTYPVHPYALTNPIWVDVDGGGFDAPGIPDWVLQAAPLP
jgi:hypothetical protein